MTSLMYEEVLLAPQSLTRLQHPYMRAFLIGKWGSVLTHAMQLLVQKLTDQFLVTPPEHLFRTGIGKRCSALTIHKKQRFCRIVCDRFGEVDLILKQFL